MTWITSDGSRSDRETIFALQPEMGETLTDFLAVAEEVNDRDLLYVCRLRMAQILGAQMGLEGADQNLLLQLEDWSNSDRFGAKEKAALDFTEQFMYSATDITEDQIAALSRELGVNEPSTFVYALYINEAALRVFAFLDVKPDGDGMAWITAGRLGDDEKNDKEFIEWVDEDSETDPKLLAAYYAFNRATCRAHGIDATTDDLVRLRSADYHNCQFCKSVRRKAEWPDGVDDLMKEAMNYRASEKISDAQKAALELLDALVVAPIQVDEELQARLLEQMSPAQIVELLMKEAFWMSNKPMISLKTDPGAVSPDHATEFVYDDEGNFIVTGTPIESAPAAY